MNTIKTTDPQEIVIGDWKYHKEFGRMINKDEVSFYVEKRLNKLLQILIEHQGTIIKRDQIIDYVWSEVHVNEENLTKGVFDLRKLLKKQGIDEIEIVTIRNIGYQLNIKEGEKKERVFLKLALKAAFYLFIGISFLIIFIRAIRYEN